MNTTTLTVENIEEFKVKALQWANLFPVVCLLDNNNYTNIPYQSWQWTLAIDSLEQFNASLHEKPLQALQQFVTGKTEDVFGFLSYEFNKERWDINESKPDLIGFPEAFFFQPRYKISIESNRVTINRNYPEAFHIIEQINNYSPPKQNSSLPPLKCRTGKNVYLEQAEKIKALIAAGDFYEINYCIEQYAEEAKIEPTAVFQKINSIAKAPFSSFFKLHNAFALCASPERFLKKVGSKLISQPIKGTIKKGCTPEENEQLKNDLYHNEKERAENVMIVDLVRNDLAKSSVPGTVQVEELCGIYSFETVNQMISTVTSTIRSDVSITEAINNAFPMGSMTGAPKIEVMKTIDKLENFRRGLYSGAIGYISPNGDFDFNVVIRSIFFNDASNYLSLKAGSAITFDSTAEDEWKEVMLKMDALKRSITS